MRDGNKKHVLCGLLIIFVALISVKYMMNRATEEKKKIVTVVLPKEDVVDSSRIMDGIRDYAMNGDFLLNVRYEENMSLEELESLPMKHKRQQGILLVYPEKYIGSTLEEAVGHDQILAITDTMTDYFSHTATFAESNERTYALPLAQEVINQLMEKEDAFIYAKNTYKLGYCSMEQMERYLVSGSMEDICLEYQRVDGDEVVNGNMNYLMTE